METTMYKLYSTTPQLFRSTPPQFNILGPLADPSLLKQIQSCGGSLQTIEMKEIDILSRPPTIVVEIGPRRRLDARRELTEGKNRYSAQKFSRRDQAELYGNRNYKGLCSNRDQAWLCRIRRHQADLCEKIFNFFFVFLSKMCL